MLTLADVDALAATAHDHQVDKIGVPYVQHVLAVAPGLAPLSDELGMAGLLHDVIEDTDWTAGHLREAGVPDRVVLIVEAVTNTSGVAYEDKIRRIPGDPDAVLVKIADNARNSHPDRPAQLPADKRDRLAANYRTARALLWSAAEPEKIETILTVVNPSLLSELAQHRAA